MAPAGVDDLGLIAQWAAAEGWLPGDGDERLFFPVDPGGFLVGRLDGLVVSSISAVRQGTGHGFLGFYLTAPDQRGRGYGLRTWQAGMRRLAGRHIGLDGVVAQQDNYRKSGFRHAWNNLRFRGTARVQAAVPGTAPVDVRRLGFEDLAAYDRRFFPARRDTFLALWISAPGHRALAVLRDGKLAGLGVGRPAGPVVRIGPLHADTPEIAARLLGALASGPVVLDVPDRNRDGVELARAAGLEQISETARMYTGEPPDIDVRGIYSVASLELG
ncbi:N-acetyltransferase GCN5 [Actinoplanes siamensis]|uniref:N-acetyltransferase GCN5 n=1 Tax=Actinoplanes siamensis TaxID=1223317 RepID=A0A919N3C8_9ACTN|nr:N-acetyltransferase GCN5 [Actinoplanes siamensis]